MRAPVRILHIVSLITPTGAYGGPVRVAVGQVKSLSQLGNDVTLVAGTMGYGKNVPETYDGIHVKLFRARTVIPKTGFAGITSLPLLLWVAKNAKYYDVVHIHLARDLLTLLAAQIVRKLNIPYVVQTHGMIDPSKKILSKPVDALWTKSAIRDASRVFYLNAREKQFIIDVAGQNLRLQELRNGVALSSPTPLTNFDEINKEVMFLSRLDAQKRALNFVEMAIRLNSKFPQVSFTLVGPDEGEGPKIQRSINAARAQEYIKWEGPLAPELTHARMASSSIFVLPSFRDAFPMSVLEAMALSIPVVVTRSCGLSEEIANSGSGIVVEDDSVESLAVGVAKLLSSRETYVQASRRAMDTIRDKFSLDSVSEKLYMIYDQIKRE
ncbi:glycosyltransferase [Arthrobacter sp. SDTb3-6]|uniref:glycosyltransferase n=1 Tax=Arthrobacter sp. SDTb3-6 TaxID=2713571 RepID=UPI00159D7EED|nr:glycosyltransferase [Arthrobacter sp. SDTb3-6]NVN00097.1 glycosyltransferase [Arthrobacter sp. SDTb3-6]